MVFARTNEAKRVLAAMCKSHDIERVYHAIAHGEVFAARVDAHLRPIESLEDATRRGLNGRH